MTWRQKPAPKIVKIFINILFLVWQYFRFYRRDTQTQVVINLFMKLYIYSIIGD